LFGKCGKSKKQFNPAAECVVASQQKKKKASNSRMKSKTVSVVILKDIPDKVPKGYARSKLMKSNRIAKVQLQRCMTSLQVRKIITDQFSAFINMEGAQFLQCGQDNSMLLTEQQELNGDEAVDLAGQGSLYLTQSKVDVSEVKLDVEGLLYCT
jgi:hypothetical protein